MLLGSRGSRTRCLVVWTAASTCLGLVGLGARAGTSPLPLTASALRATPLDAALTDLAALTLLACAAWMWVATTAVVIEALRGPFDAAPSDVPAGVRRVVLAACGVALAGGLAQSSQAAAPSAVPAPHHRSGPLLAGLPLPDRAVATSSSRPPTVLVRPGDTLWSIAADDLPEGSRAQQITERWRAIYASNSDLIGPDPDVIVPGQRLRLPGKDPS